MDGTAAIHLQRASPAAATLNPSHCGSSQNHSAKKPAPTRSDATAVSHRRPFPFPVTGPLVISASRISPPLYRVTRKPSVGYALEHTLGRADGAKSAVSLRVSYPLA